MSIQVASPGGIAARIPDKVIEQGKISATNLLVVLGQLGLLTLALRQFQIESGAFPRLVLLAFAGFVVHVTCPLRRYQGLVRKVHG